MPSRSTRRSRVPNSSKFAEDSAGGISIRVGRAGQPGGSGGLLADDRIIAVNRQRVSTLAQLREAAKGQASMLVQLRRGNQVLLLPLR